MTHTSSILVPPIFLANLCSQCLCHCCTLGLKWFHIHPQLPSEVLYAPSKVMLLLFRGWHLCNMLRFWNWLVSFNLIWFNSFSHSSEILSNMFVTVSVFIFHFVLAAGGMPLSVSASCFAAWMMVSAGMNPGCMMYSCLDLTISDSLIPLVAANQSCEYY